MSRDATIFHRTSDTGAAQRSWAGLTPDLLENARGRVRTLAWLMLVGLGLASGDTRSGHRGPGRPLDGRAGEAVVGTASAGSLADE